MEIHFTSLGLAKGKPNMESISEFDKSQGSYRLVDVLKLKLKLKHQSQ
jgi:hypothetical protein